MRKIIPLMVCLVFVSQIFCNSTKKKVSENNSEITIKYVNLEVVYTYLIKNDKNAITLKQTRNTLELQMERLYVMKKSLAPELYKKNEQEYQQKLLKVIADEKTYKKKLLQQVNIVIKRVAAKYQADYILNIGDEVVYGNKKHDVTEEVIRELEFLKRRSSPLSR